MRVLYFTQDWSAHDQRFLSALAQTAHKVYALSLSSTTQRVEERLLPALGGQVEWVGSLGGTGWLGYPGLRLAFRKLVRRIQPHLIHAGPLPTSAFLAALSGFRPLVSMSWGSDLLREIDLDRTKWHRAQYALKHSAVLAADCQAVQQSAVQMGFPGERVVIFPWGVDLRTFTPTAASRIRQQLGWQDAFVLLSLRSWEPLYGVQHVVRAFARAAEKIPELRLLLLGDGSQAGQIRGLIDTLQLQERVHLGGRVANDELPEFYRAADLYVSASLSDGSSVSLLEALACGIPVLVSDIPGNREWVEDGHVGWTFAAEDEEALAKGIARAVRERHLLPGMAQSARLLAQARADWSVNFARLLEAYQMAVQIGKG